MRNKWIRIIIFLLISAALIILDQLFKGLATEYLSQGHTITLIPSVLSLVYVENRGAAFGILQGQQGIFFVLTIIVLFGILYMVCQMPLGKRSRPMIWTLVLLFSGAVGNFIDRMRNSYVVDFIYFMPIDFPVFNFADILITISCISLVFLYFFYYNNDEFPKGSKRNNS